MQELLKNYFKHDFPAFSWPFYIIFTNSHLFDSKLSSYLYLKKAGYRILQTHQGDVQNKSNNSSQQDHLAELHNI